MFMRLSVSGQLSDVRIYKDVVKYCNILAILNEAVDWHGMLRQHMAYYRQSNDAGHMVKGTSIVTLPLKQLNMVH